VVVQALLQPRKRKGVCRVGTTTGPISFGLTLLTEEIPCVLLVLAGACGPHRLALNTNQGSTYRCVVVYVIALTPISG
jgi:hypothetical protein